MSEADLTPVSVESSDGRVLTGVGTTTEALTEVMERHAPPAAPATAPPKEPKGRARFDALTAEREAEKTARTAAETERDALKQRLEALEKAPPTAAVPAAPAEPVAAPEKFTFPTYETYLVSNPNATWDDWNDAKIDAHSDWKIAKLDLDGRVRSTLDAERASRAVGETISAVDERGRKAYPDFEAVRTNGPGSSINLGPTPAHAAARVQAILKLSNSEHVQYAIGKDAALAHRLAAMTDVEFGIALASLAPASAAASPASTAQAGSVTPPPPYQPVGSGSKTTVPPSAELIPKAGYDFDKSGYREKRAAERGVNRRR